jgi:hypothetical protein
MFVKTLRFHLFHYNDVSNQQDATSFSFICLFKSALPVSGDKFAHPQEHFCYNEPVGSSVGALYQKLYIQSKNCPKHVGLI